MNSSLLWLEIPVSNFDRAIFFYEKVFAITLEKKILFDKQMALFTAKQMGIKGCLVLTENFVGSNGIKPFFTTAVMSETIERVLENKGKIVSTPSLIRQKNKDGDVIIGSNLIDDEIGYYSEIEDSEGNHFYLYSHS